MGINSLSEDYIMCMNVIDSSTCYPFDNLIILNRFV